MSDIYKEALADAVKIREIAELDARNAILEKISPYIKQMIVKESSGLFLEQEEEDPNAPPLPVDPSATDPAAVPASAALPMPDPTVPDPAMAAPAEVAPVPDPAAAMPITPAPGEDVVNVPMPTSGDGKITLNFDDLFTKDSSEIMNPMGMEDPSSVEVASPEAPTDLTAAPAGEAEAGPMPAPEVAGAAAELPPEEEVPGAPMPLAEIKSINDFEKVLAETALKIDTIYTVDVGEMTKNSLKNKLFSLLEQLDYFKTENVITTKQAQLNENRLEFLFLHLKEANVNNTYNKKKDKDMTTLKDFAAKLFENSDLPMTPGDSASTGKTGVPTHKKATEHAKKASGVHADLFAGGDTLEIVAASGTTDADALEGLEGEEGGWEEALLEEIKKEILESRTVELDEAALRAAVRNIRLESAAKKSKVASDAKVAAKKKIKENLELSVELPADVESQLNVDDLMVDLQLTDGGDEMGSDEEGMEMDGEVFGDEDEEMMSSDDGMDSSDDLDGGSDMDLDHGSDDESDFGGDEMEMSGGDDMGSEEEDVVLTDEEEPMEEVALMESAKVRKLMKLHEASRKQNSGLKKEMAETNLFLAKLVYLNKFLVREDLNRSVKQQIVEHLDRAKTIAEAKTIYGKINKKLDEAVAKHSAPVVGSASKPTTAGSVRLQEGATKSDNSPDGSAVIGTYDKWQVLSGIKKRND